jgi:hypothetical protein
MARGKWQMANGKGQRANDNFLLEIGFAKGYNNCSFFGF